MRGNSHKLAVGGVGVAGFVAILAYAPAANAQTPATVNVSVDATSPGSPIERVWDFHGYDEVNYTTTAPGQALLKTLGAIDTTPPHIRTHFLLNTGNGVPSFKWGSTNAYTADANGNAIYDWTLMDAIMDTITGAGALPFVEIGFMPHDLSVHPDPYQNSGVYNLDGGCFYPPKDYSKWGALVAAWATHSNARYSGVGSAWQWELWNEPDIGYWQGTPAEYDQLFDYTEASLHQVLPTAPLGGPAVAGTGAFLTQFLQHCATGTNSARSTTGTRLDMVTFHAKGGVAIVGGHVEMNLGNQLVLHRNGFNAVAGFPQFKQTPIVVSEADPDGCAACPVSQNPADAYRNSPAYGAYEVAMMKKSLELEARIGVKLQGLLTWAFLFNGQPYFAGYRVLSSNDIHLPVLNAFKLLGRLSGSRLPVTSTGALTIDQIMASSVRQQADVDALATFDGQSVQVLVWNYHDDIVAAAASPVHLSVRVPAAFGSRAIVTHLRVDDTHGDAYGVWTSQGSPAAPSATQIAQLAQAMEPADLVPLQTVDVVSNAVNLYFDLPRFGLSLVTLTAPGATDASAGDSATAGGTEGGASPGADGSVSSPPGGSSSGGSSSGGSALGVDGAASPVDGSTGGGGPPQSGGSSGAGAGTPTSPSHPHSGCGCRLMAARMSAPTPVEGIGMLVVGLLGAGSLRRIFFRTNRTEPRSGRASNHDRGA
jgi:xylan 1,4-beta-xylosidase